MRPPAELQLDLWHVGAVVADIGASIRDELMMGAAGASPAVTLDIESWDAATGRLAREQLAVAWIGYGGGRPALELISPLDRDGEGPQSRLLRVRGGPTHMAYWCADMIAAAQWLLDRGAEPVIAPMLAPPGENEGLAGKAFLDVLGKASACYLRLPAGGVVELNPATALGYMPMVWGEGVLAQVPASRHSS